MYTSLGCLEVDLSSINPWWRIPPPKDPGDTRDIEYVKLNIVERDRELSTYAHGKVRIRPQEIELLTKRTVRFRGQEIPVIALPIVITVRGPRQIGKTTFLKLLILRLLGYDVRPLKGGYLVKRRPRITGNLNVIYIDCDKLGIEEHRELISVAESVLKEHSGISKGRFYLFIDEITNVRNWSRAAKGLVEIALGSATIILTGSHSLDVRILSETLAGRRGEERIFRQAIPSGPDIEYLPLRFREYVANLNPDIRDLLWDLGLMTITKRMEFLLDILSLKSTNIPSELNEIKIKYGEELERYFYNYLLTGGIPKVIDEYYSYGSIDSSTYETYIELVLKDAYRLGLSERVLLDVIHEIIESLSSPIGIAKIAQKIGLGRDTVFRHIEFLEHAFVLMYLYPYDIIKDKKYITGMPRKYFIIDPFIIHAFRAKTLGFTSPFEISREYVMSPSLRGRLFESVVAAHLRYLTREVAGTPLYIYNEFIYYGKANSGEIDFVVYLPAYRKSIRKMYREKLGIVSDAPYISIEVTSEEKIDRRYITSLVKASSAKNIRGIAVTSKNMGIYRTFAEIPIYLFLLLI